MQEDERALAAKSFKERVNPAARIYAAAKARGFNANSESKLEKVSQGMQKGKSLPRAGGKNAEKQYDISRINDMSEKEFDQFFNQVKEESKESKSWLANHCPLGFPSDQSDPLKATRERVRCIIIFRIVLILHDLLSVDSIRFFRQVDQVSICTGGHNFRMFLQH